MTAEYREVRLQRLDRPYEAWRCLFEEAGPGKVIASCGVCLEGIIEQRVDAACSHCGAVVTYVYWPPGACTNTI